jgi:hypothetical protein
MESQTHPSVPHGSTNTHLAADVFSFLPWLSESEKTADWNSPRALKKVLKRVLWKVGSGNTMVATLKSELLAE